MSSIPLRITPQPLTAQAWAPFGWLPVSDTDPADGRHRLEFAWDDAHLNVIHHTREEIGWSDGAALCAQLFRHDTHTQALMVLNVPSIIAVAPAGRAFSDPADLAAVEAFALAPGDAFVLHRSTWHWGPYPVEAARVDLFNLQGRRYAEDNACADLAAAGGPVHVLAG